MFHVGKRGRGSCEHLWLGFQDPPCCVSLQHHIQNCHMVFTFSFTYRVETLLPIELKIMILRTITMMRLPLDESQHHWLLQFNVFEELQLRTHQSIKVAQVQQKKTFDNKVEKKEFKKVTLSWCLTFNIITWPIKNCWLNGLDLLSSRRC
jgi:hypothetical protein